MEFTWVSNLWSMVRLPHEQGLEDGIGTDVNTFSFIC
jgi:hypothetical protein